MRVKNIVKDLVGIMVIVVMAFCTTAQAAVDFNKSIHKLNIPASNAAEALNELAFQTGAVLLFPYEEAKAQQANAVAGNYTLKHAITILFSEIGNRG